MRTLKSKQRSRSKSRPRDYKPSLANLMTHYNPNENYNIKLNMNYENPQIIQTKAYQLSNKSKQINIKCKKKKPISDLINFDDLGVREIFSSNSKYTSNFSSNRVTPKRARPNNLLNLESQYFVSQHSSKNMSRQGFGLFKEAIKKQSRENSIVVNSDYYEMIEKKANEIKQQKKKMLQKCHSDGTLSSVLENMKKTTNNQIEEYARKILDDKQNVSLNQTKAGEKTQSKVNETVGDKKENNSIFNNQFSFQIENMGDTQYLKSQNFFQLSNGEESGRSNRSSINKQSDYFNIQPLNLVNRPLANHSDERQNTGNCPDNNKFQKVDKVDKIQKISEINGFTPRGTCMSNYSNFKSPRAATVYTEIQTKYVSHNQILRQCSPPGVSMVPIIRKNSVFGKEKWIKVDRPEKVDYLSEVLQCDGLHPSHQPKQRVNF